MPEEAGWAAARWCRRSRCPQNTLLTRTSRPSRRSAGSAHQAHCPALALQHLIADYNLSRPAARTPRPRACPAAATCRNSSSVARSTCCPKLLIVSPADLGRGRRRRRRADRGALPALRDADCAVLVVSEGSRRAVRDLRPYSSSSRARGRVSPSVPRGAGHARADRPVDERAVGRRSGGPGMLRLGGGPASEAIVIAAVAADRAGRHGAGRHRAVHAAGQGSGSRGLAMFSSMPFRRRRCGLRAVREGDAADADRGSGWPSARTAPTCGTSARRRAVRAGRDLRSRRAWRCTRRRDSSHWIVVPILVAGGRSLAAWRGRRSSRSCATRRPTPARSSSA